jgi:DNA helicase-2/ATP-dependent DNA helicase PcrA
VKYVLKTSAPVRLPFSPELDLNPQQRAVVEAPLGVLLVIAGAGTGKTRTLTYRVARLVAGGCPPERILLCTFTNRAAREMVERVQGLIQLDMRRCFAGTFHHIGNRLLRRHADSLGLAADFGILDPEDARTLLASVVAELGLEKLTAKRFPPTKQLMGVASFARGTGQPLADVLAAKLPRMIDQVPAMEDVLRRYDARKRAMNLCDFDDLLVRWHELLVRPEHAETAQALRAAFDHVLVDEYQDINALQGALVDGMAARCGSLTAVGDDAQSIYAFRGADFEQIAGFLRRHPEASIQKLTINYRSTPQILALANRCIVQNRRQHPKELVAVKGAGMVPAVIPLRDVYQQAELVAQRVLELHHEQTLPLHKMAVLYRNHGHSLELQVELARRQIPFRIRSGVKFFEQAHVKDVVAYLRARENPRDGLAWTRLLRQWPGVGAQTAERIAARLCGLLGDEDKAEGTGEQARDGAEPFTGVLPPPPSVEVLEQAATRARGRGREARTSTSRRRGRPCGASWRPTTASTPIARSATVPPVAKTSSTSPATPTATPPRSRSSTRSRSCRASRPRTWSRAASPTTCSCSAPSTRPRASSGRCASCSGSPTVASRPRRRCDPTTSSRRSGGSSTWRPPAPPTSSTSATRPSRRRATAR